MTLRTKLSGRVKASPALLKLNVSLKEIGIAVLGKALCSSPRETVNGPPGNSRVVAVLTSIGISSIAISASKSTV